MSEAAPKRRGRKPLVETPEERRQRLLAYKAKSRAKTRNITLDADLLDEIDRVEDKLEEQWGFRPTHSQTVRWLIRQAMTN